MKTFRKHNTTNKNVYSPKQGSLVKHTYTCIILAWKHSNTNLLNKKTTYNAKSTLQETLSQKNRTAFTKADSYKKTAKH